ncbi:hypothetical protein [Reyranella soli]|uniref:Uncharacterized protein n=1 Tax=Reyranella soli TaxID=1230389 RepID=A0A512NSP6_9HYPH|nr:hypothetical protein [Reyranella soli]GEP61964.1 hypothetical protein RSO01_91300 [Reyranella soli]
MKSAFDCFQHAAKCEQLASTATNDASRTTLFAAAAHWRKLGNAAKVRERREESYDLAQALINLPRPRPKKHPLLDPQRSSE